MKSIKPFLAAAFLSFSPEAFAQGQIFFANRSIVDGIDAPCIDISTGQLASGANGWFAQLYLGTTFDSLNPIGVAVQFRSDEGIGYVPGTVVDVALPGGSTVFVQMAAWKGAGSFEAAPVRATSNILVLRLSDLSASPPETPTPLHGLVLPVPEPSSASLIALAGGVVAAFKRRNRASSLK